MDARKHHTPHRQTRARAILAVAALAGATTALTACTDTTETTENPAVSAVDDPAVEFTSVYDEAQANGADSVQLAALADEEVSFEEYKQGVAAALECMSDGGIEVFGGEVDNTGPFPMIQYGFAAIADGLTEDETLAYADACLAAHSSYLEMEYQTSDAAQEAIDARFDERKGEFIACLEEAGTTVPAEATIDELRQFGIELAFSADPTNCFAEAGVQ